MDLKKQFSADMFSTPPDEVREYEKLAPPPEVFAETVYDLGTKIMELQNAITKNTLMTNETLLLILKELQKLNANKKG